ncbi:MAG: LysR family transcriptional regulator [Bradyrhizobium sp.]|uniref:LysR family transcriptional regulator n=1 Tax=Bradyrhizobium sp. TaxID=376 RepID=UPI0025C22633|nr:LysR family transcriptional regulator [Bradyrhizobium sp.]MBI5264467.1 LysR family transcriptional regulator [Bradyrhizobium sp.]
MPTIPNRGGPEKEHAKLGVAVGGPDWEAIRAFLELARCGSIRSAAERMGLSANALRRKIDDLERALGTVLVTRHVDGVRPTAEGEEILLAAKRMEDAAFGLVRTRNRQVPAMSGKVRIGITEAFGTFWLGPRLVDFQRAYPQLTIDLMCAMRNADVLRLEADMAVQLTRPNNPDMKGVRLGRIHSMLAAAPSYLSIYGTPKSVADLRKHRLALQFAEQTRTEELVSGLFPDMELSELVKFSTNNSTALLWAIIKGAGIGWSPTYIHVMGPKMVPLDIGAVFPFDVWLTYHPDAARVPRVRRLIDWIIENFDPKVFPWFKDEFVHPRDLPAQYHGPPLVNLFEGISWDKTNNTSGT